VPQTLKIVLLAAVQGLTEFFPVSSSGHLVLFQHWLDFNTLPLVYDIFFHLGTLLAVVVYFFSDLKELALRFYRKENLRLIGLLATASVPTALIGFLLKDFFESLFSRTSHLGLAFLFTGVVLLAGRFLRLNGRIPDLAAALIIGVAQGIAITPGVSRSGTTIAVALVLGLGFDFSFRFSFLLSIPAVLGALLLESSAVPWSGGHWPHLALAVAVAALTGLLSLALLRRIVARDRFHRFAWYVLPLGALVLAFF